MARPTSSKKVSRAAQTGGGRTTRGTQSWLYWALIVGIVVLGITGLWFSRVDRRREFAAAATGVPPIARQDHWHTAYGIYICDQFIEPITDQRDPEGIHTHADGVIHVHPFVSRSSGENAKLSKVFDAVQLDLSDSEIEVPGGETYNEGDDECDGEPGVMQLKVKGREEVITENIEDFRFDEDRQVITIAFAPEGAEIPLPPSEPTLDNLSDVEPAQQQPAASSTTVAGDPAATTAPPAESTTTAAP